MPLNLHRGSAFIATHNHLCVVVIEPTETPSVVVIVNLSSVRNTPKEDHTVIVRHGDHEFVRHDSFVAYEYAKRVTVDCLANHLEAGRMTVQPDVSAELYKKILDGLYQSSRTPSNIKSMCRRINRQST